MALLQTLSAGTGAAAASLRAAQAAAAAAGAAAKSGNTTAGGRGTTAGAATTGHSTKAAKGARAKRSASRDADEEVCATVGGWGFQQGSNLCSKPACRRLPAGGEIHVCAAMILSQLASCKRCCQGLHMSRSVQ
jgi:hypothetical protein